MVEMCELTFTHITGLVQFGAKVVWSSSHHVVQHFSWFRSEYISVKVQNSWPTQAPGSFISLELEKRPEVPSRILKILWIDKALLKLIFFL